MNNAAFGTMENVRKYRDIKLVRTERRRNYLVLKPNYHATKVFTENVLAIEMKKTQIIMIALLYQLHYSCKNRLYLSFEKIAEDVKKRFGKSNFKIDRPLPRGKNKKVIG